MKVSTKQRIIEKAIALFNKKGYTNVTLFEIAGELNMTRGNLTYHFKTKELLLQTISTNLWAKIEADRSKSRYFPSFENLHGEAQFYYRYQRSYSFIFLDYHVLNHPVIKPKFRELTAQQIKDNETTIAFAISAGNMHPEPYPGLYRNLAFNCWMVFFYWLNQQIIRGKDIDTNDSEAEMKIWSLLLPHFTEKGIHGFKKYFGEDALKKLGKPWDITFDLDNYVTF